jgi:hypothetical protein
MANEKGIGRPKGAITAITQCRPPEDIGTGTWSIPPAAKEHPEKYTHVVYKYNYNITEPYIDPRTKKPKPRPVDRKYRLKYHHIVPNEQAMNRNISYEFIRNEQIMKEANERGVQYPNLIRVLECKPYVPVGGKYGTDTGDDDDETPEDTSDAIAQSVQGVDNPDVVGGAE